MLWRDHKAIKPYLTAKGGLLVFPQKVLSQEASYVNFSLQSAMGVQARLTERFDLRLGLFSDFHFSDDFIVPVNPGLDVIEREFGLDVPSWTPEALNVDSSLLVDLAALPVARPLLSIGGPCALSDLRWLCFPLQLLEWSTRIRPAAEWIRCFRGLPILAPPALQSRRLLIQRDPTRRAAVHPYFILGGAQYTWRIGRESIFVEGLGGTGAANQSWGTNNAVGQTAAFAALAGGGLDTPLSRHIAFRLDGGFQYSYFGLEQPVSKVPYRIPGLPTDFGRFSSGLVWQF